MLTISRRKATRSLETPFSISSRRTNSQGSKPCVHLMIEPTLTLLGQEATRHGLHPAELEIGTNDDWLIRCHPDGKRNVSNPIQSRTTGHGVGPVEVPRVRGQERYRGGPGFTGVGSDRARS